MITVNFDTDVTNFDRTTLLDAMISTGYKPQQCKERPGFFIGSTFTFEKGAVTPNDKRAVAALSPLVSEKIGTKVVEKYLNAGQAAKALGVTAAMFRTIASNPKCPTVLKGKRKIYLASAVQAFLASTKVPAAPAPMAKLPSNLTIGFENGEWAVSGGYHHEFVKSIKADVDYTQRHWDERIRVWYLTDVPSNIIFLAKMVQAYGLTIAPSASAVLTPYLASIPKVAQTSKAPVFAGKLTGQVVKAKRKSLNMMAKDLAKAARIDKSCISRFELGKGRMSEEKLARIAGVLKLAA